LAWHCIRAGRQEQAIPFLLAGAREAMQCGAPHETELALSTALPTLPLDTAAEARLLIVEAIQEQGRWDESLEVLQTSETDLQQPVRVAILKARVAVQRWSLTASEYDRIRRAMLAIADGSSDPLTRLRAVQVAAQTLNELRSVEAACEVLSSIDRLTSTSFNRHELIERGIARAKALFFKGDRLASIAEVGTLLGGAGAAPRPANGTTLNLCVSAGAISVAAGNYYEALAHYAEAYRLAIRLGRQDGAASAAGNLSLCYFRTGETSEQLRWAETCLQLGERYCSCVGRLHAMYCRAAAHAFREENRVVRACISETDLWINGGMADWVSQCWLLYRADLLAIIGARTEAVASARRTISYAALAPRASYYTGAYARWCALAATTQTELKTAHTYLLGLRATSDERDALDDVEILAALCSLYSGGIELAGELQGRLQKMPSGVAKLLVAIKLLH
jgi:tetratricopeptide (TPR) repeat protein